MPESLKDKTVKGVIWSSVERFSVQGVQFFVTLIIARILSPKDYGLVGMLSIFMAVSQSLIDSGFSQALIRKQNRTEIDNSTVFYFNIAVSSLLYLILFLIAPWVADFYNEPQLTALMRVLCIVVVINSFAVVQRAIYTATINFKTQAKATFSATIISGIAGVIFALNGFGVWTLVYQQLLSAFLNTLMLWIYSNWRPQLIYSWKSFKELFSFGSNLLISGLLNTTYNNLYQLVIGKIFSASSLGFYSQAKHITDLPSTNINGIIGRVTYPVLSSIQNDDERLSKNYRTILRLSAFIIFPIMCLLAGVAHPLITLLIGEKWDFAATLTIPICFSTMWYPVHAINLNLLKVKGRSDLFLRLEIIKKIIGVTVLTISIPFGLIFMCWASILSSLISLIINTYYTGKLIHVGFFVQMRDISATLVTALLAFTVAYLTCTYVKIPILNLCIGLFAGGFVYWGTAYFLKFKELTYIKSIRK